MSIKLTRNQKRLLLAAVFFTLGIIAILMGSGSAKAETTQLPPPSPGAVQLGTDLKNAIDGVLQIGPNTAAAIDKANTDFHAGVAQLNANWVQTQADVQYAVGQAQVAIDGATAQLRSDVQELDRQIQVGTAEVRTAVDTGVAQVQSDLVEVQTSAAQATQEVVTTTQTAINNGVAQVEADATELDRQAKVAGATVKTAVDTGVAQADADVRELNRQVQVGTAQVQTVVTTTVNEGVDNAQTGFNAAVDNAQGTTPARTDLGTLQNAATPQQQTTAITTVAAPANTSPGRFVAPKLNVNMDDAKDLGGINGASTIATADVDWLQVLQNVVAKSDSSNLFGRQLATASTS